MRTKKITSGLSGDVISIGSKDELVPLVDRPDLPPGPTWQCPECGAYLRTNEHHLANRHTILFISGKPHLYGA